VATQWAAKRVVSGKLSKRSVSLWENEGMDDPNGSREVAEYEVAVVGGGIAGLFAAWQLRERDVVLLEADDRVGGRVKTVRRGDYWANLGAQYMAGTGPLADVLEEFEVPRGSLVGTRAALGLNGRVLASDKPAEFVLKSPLSMRGRYDFARYGLRVRRMYRRLTENSNPEDARRFRDEMDDSSAELVGEGIKDSDVRAIFEAFVEAWVAGEPSEVSAWHFLLYMGSALTTAAETPNFSLPVGGNEVIPETLGEALADNLRLSAAVSAISWGERGVEIEYSDSQGSHTLRANQCVVATPAHIAGSILKGLPAEHRRALDSVRYGHYVVAGIFTGEKDAQAWDNLYSIAVPGRSFQVIYNHAAALRREGPRRPGGALVAYAGGDRSRELEGLSDSEISSRFVRDLDEVLTGSGGIVEEVVVQRWPQALPIWRPGDRPLTRKLREPLGPIHFAGDYLGLPSMATAARSGEAAGRSALEVIGAARDLSSTA
jgi:monoamine oxidase